MSLILCRTRLLQHKAVSEKDVWISSTMPLPVIFVYRFLLATFCGLGRIRNVRYPTFMVLLMWA